MIGRFEGCGREGSQWVLDADAKRVSLEHEVSTNGSRLVRDDDDALARLLACRQRMGGVLRNQVGQLLAPQTRCALELSEGDVLATFDDAWVFART